MTGSTPIASPWALLRDTWPPRDTWRGFTATIAEGLYISWIVSAPLWPFVTWLKLGASLIALCVVRTIILRTTLLDPPARPRDKSEWRWRYRPLTYFFHRNFALNATACLAAVGADQVGAFVLIALGATVDWRREWHIRRRSVAPQTAKIRGTLLTELSIAFLIFVFFLSYLCLGPIKGHYFVTSIDEIARTIGHFQSAISEYSRALDQHSSFDDAIRFRIVLALDVVILIYFGIVKHDAVMGSYLAPVRVLIGLRSPLIIMASFLMCVTFAYYVISLYGPVERMPLVLRGRPNFSFSRLNAVNLFFAFAIITAFSMGLFGILTQLRAGLPDGPGPNRNPED
jgi:hypothetical protein